MAPGIFMVDGMTLRVPGKFSIPLGDEPLEPIAVTLRLDLWPMWLETGCIHAASAADITTQLTPDLDDASKNTLVKAELQQAMVAMTAFAFAVDGFYGVVQQEMGRHPHAALWHQKREAGKSAPARHVQVVETLKHHLKLKPEYVATLRSLIEQLFNFRSRAVHPRAEFVSPSYRPELDSGVHPHMVTFSGPNAVQTRAVVLFVLAGLVERAAEVAPPDVERGWLVKGREELERMMPLYRVPGDDVLAWSDYRAPNPRSERE